MSRNAATIYHRCVDTHHGQVHVAESGSGRPVLLLHQTPRSWREFEEVLLILGSSFRAIAMDTLGFGQSARPATPLTMEMLASSVEQTLDALSVAEAVLVGHHTGGSIAVEVAASVPDRVSALVLSATTYWDEAQRKVTPAQLITPDAEGNHLRKFWEMADQYYEPQEYPLKTRFVLDAVGSMASIGDIRAAASSYKMESRLPLITTPSTLLCGANDPWGLDHLPSLQRVLGCSFVIVEGAGVGLPEQKPQAFSDVIQNFLTTNGPRGSQSTEFPSPSDLRDG